MKIVRKLILTPLSSQISVSVLFVAAVPVAFSSAKLLSDANEGVFFFALFGIIVSCFFAVAGYIVPKSIREKTTVAGYFLWVLLFLSFSVAALFYSSKLVYGSGISTAMLSLLLLIIFFFAFDLYSDLKKQTAKLTEPGSAIILFKSSLYTCVIIITLALLTIPFFVAASDVKLNQLLYVASFLHVAAFLAYLLSSMIVAVHES